MDFQDNIFDFKYPAIPNTSFEFESGDFEQLLSFNQQPETIFKTEKIPMNCDEDVDDDIINRYIGLSLSGHSPMPQFLLQTGYKLGMKEICFGFSGKFEPRFMIINERRKFVILKSLEFDDLLSSAYCDDWSVKDFFNTPKNFVLPSNNCFELKQSKQKGKPFAVLTYKGDKQNRVNFSVDDLTTLNNLKFLLSSKRQIMEFDKHRVDAFYSWYLEKCFRNAFNRMRMEHFEKPFDAGLNIDYIRLHCEIPEFLKQKLEQDLKNKQKNQKMVTFAPHV